MGAATPSKVTLVPPAVVVTLPSAPRLRPASDAGPNPDPKMVTISPGATPPPLNVAALTTPAAVTTIEDGGGGAPGFTVIFAVALLVGSAKEAAVTVIVVGAATWAGGVYT